MLDVQGTAVPPAASADKPADEPAGGSERDRGRTRRLRWLAAGLGLLGTLAALAVPFLPVGYDVADLHWPTATGAGAVSTGAVSAPLPGYQPLSVDVNLPCAVIRGLSARTGGSGDLVATVPPSSAYGNVTGLSVELRSTQVVVTDDGQQLASAAVPAGGCALAVHSDGGNTTVRIGSQVLASLNSDLRPQVVGIYSDLNARKDDVRGLTVDIQPDTRYQTTATALKIGAMIVALLAFIGAGIALHKMDVWATGRRARLVPRGWWRPTGRDAAVIGVLVVWWLIGAVTSDDGYILTMARNEATTGYIGNIYRWFDSPEAPFGWFYEVYARWVLVSTSTPWVRLPAMLMGVGSWLLISREVLPRLGREVRRSRAAGWAGATTFLAFWLPFDNGLRPESVVVIWTLLVMCGVERTVATRRLLPAALGLFAAAFALAATPTGLISIAPFLSAARPLALLLRDRVRRFGRLAVLAPLASCGTIVLVAVFQNQTLRSVIDSTKSRMAIGPAENWYQEMDRYQALFTNSADGSLARRFPVLLIILCLVTCLVVLLKRGKIPGAALGPSRRLIGTTILSFALLALTPTKWTHHFGAFAALGGSLAALTALATSASVLRSRRNRALFTGVLLIIASAASTGPNAWWYVSSWGSPWFDKPPSIGGHSASSVLDIAALIALVIAAVEHLRGDLPGRQQVVRPMASGRRLRLASAPVAVVCALLVLAEVGNFVKVIEKEWGSYSLGKDNVMQLAGHSCGLSDYISVEPNPERDFLAPVGEPGGSANGPALTGFTLGGLPPDAPSDLAVPVWLPPLPATAAAPVWGNYGSSGPKAAGQLRTSWYPLPASARSGAAPLIVDVAGVTTGGNSLVAEFGKRTGSGFQVLQQQPIGAQTDTDPTIDPTSWRESRVTLTGAAAQADDVRLVANTQAVGQNNWLAVSAPRVPTMVRMTDFLGSKPVFMEWPVALVDPCIRPYNTQDGISEMPAYRIAGGTDLRDVGQTWSAPDAGGPFGWLNVNSTETTLPTFLQGDLNRDWGTLYAIAPDARAAPASAALQVQHVTHWGLYSPGPGSRPIELPGVPQKSNDRGNVSVSPPGSH
ncbi:MAG TPA: arabinosyltransferase domain-containing protein [Pseudonocardiaceae bacterium]|nr:arabinosyltransferase domain-containing protein [Pseudonocardiaceae bacterium]